MPDASFEYIIRLPEARDSQTYRRRAAMFRDLGQASARPPGVLPGWTLGAHRQCVHRAESQAPGLARKLMETMLEWCASHEIDQVTLAPSDEGRPLYRALGFKPANGHEAGALK
jgi:GNAT superfamily N-acetyltransferase